MFYFTGFVTYKLSSLSASFKTDQNLEKQVKLPAQKSLKLSFFCPNCGKGYTWKKNLRRHLSLECGKTPSQRCPYCSYICNHKADLIRHVRRRHASSHTYLVQC